MMKTILPALALATMLPATAQADQVMSVPPFKTIEVHGGGEVILRHGDVQRVTLIKGDPKIAEIRVRGDGRLMLSPCSGMCWGNHQLKAEIVTPAIAGVSVHGGGDLEAEGTFPAQPSLAVAVHGGGSADVRVIPADNVSASVHGGGEADVRAEKSLTAAVHGGGELRYWGHPQVTSAIHGGGSVEAGE